jgi:hypothetical protein
VSADPGAAQGSEDGWDPGAGAPGGPQAPSEEELRRAYEAELSRITTTDMMAQTAISLLNLGARRLGAPPGAAPRQGTGADSGKPDEDTFDAAAAGRDLEQVRDAIDGVRALMGILERRLAAELGPLRDALSQLQMAYAREVQMSSDPATPGGRSGQGGGGEGSSGIPGGGSSGQEAPKQGGQAPPSGKRPGPAESSGRMWVPGR